MDDRVVRLIYDISSCVNDIKKQDTTWSISRIESLLKELISETKRSNQSLSRIENLLSSIKDNTSK